MINSKQKGNRFELVTAKLLTEVTGIKWYRVGVSSGARYTTIGAEKYRGDVTTDHPEFQKYIIEAKATTGRISLEDIVTKKSKFNRWIEQCIGESDDDNWILIFKANNGKIFCVTPRENEFGEKYKLNLIAALKLDNKQYKLYWFD